MSNDVVISKEMRDKLLKDLARMASLDYERCIAVCEGWDNALRSAPETVSLEGVEPVAWHHKCDPPFRRGDGVTVFEELDMAGRYKSEIEAAEYGFEPCYRKSDLHRLVAPVQPSAVVSRDAIIRAISRFDFTNKEGDTQELYDEDVESLVAIIESLQLPQPVAPDDKSPVLWIQKDQDTWIVTGPTFTNLQTSDDYAYGDTKEEALDSYFLMKRKPVARVQSGGVDKFVVESCAKVLSLLGSGKLEEAHNLASDLRRLVSSRRNHE